MKKRILQTVKSDLEKNGYNVDLAGGNLQRVIADTVNRRKDNLPGLSRFG
jgi:hypothetical protein